MRDLLKTLTCASVLVLATVVSGWCAGEKVAVIDFERVLKDYHKTKPAEAEIDKQKADFKVEIERRLKTLEQMEQDYEAAREAARNKALKEEALKTKLADAEKRLMELQEYQQDIKRFSDDEKKRIVQESIRMRRRLSDEIQEAVRKHAVDKGLLLVVDSSSSIEDLRGSVVFRDDSVDITSAIVKAMNEGKPVNEDKAAKPEPKK